MCIFIAALAYFTLSVITEQDSVSHILQNRAAARHTPCTYTVYTFRDIVCINAMCDSQFTPPYGNDARACQGLPPSSQRVHLEQLHALLPLELASSAHSRKLNGHRHPVAPTSVFGIKVVPYREAGDGGVVPGKAGRQVHSEARARKGHQRR